MNKIYYSEKLEKILQPSLLIDSFPFQFRDGVELFSCIGDKCIKSPLPHGDFGFVLKVNSNSVVRE